MKKFYYILAVTALVTLWSCGGSHETNQGGDKSDSALTEEMESPVAGPTEFYLTADSIGPVKVGDLISDLPAAVPNLYDMMLTTDTPDAMAYTFLLATVPQFTVYDFMEGKVDVILLEGDARGVQTPDGEIRVGDDFEKVLALKGVESEWENFDDGGIWYWKWNGLYFGVDEMGLSRKFSEALMNSNMPPRASMFSDKIKIGYIGTGLPF